MFGVKTNVILFFRRLYWNFRLKGAAEKIRGKSKIRVLFVVTELSPWKTELLYQHMLVHPKFEPLLGLSSPPEMPSSYEQLQRYCKKKGYVFFDLDAKANSLDVIDPDIVFYQKPYMGVYKKHLRYNRMHPRLICHVNYAFHTLNESWGIWQPMLFFVWQHYYENHLAADERLPKMKNKGKNVFITGMPIQDDFLKPKSFFEDPWKNKDGKKRIIYAPHHSIGDLHIKGIDYSTFLENAEFMLDLAKKYSNSVQFAFKPHPLLFDKLKSVWGERRAKAYYDEWAQMSNTQLENGPYVALFKHSNAMIHDCSSFTVEYLYSQNPVLYLTKNNHHSDNLGAFGKKAFDLHYKSSTQRGISEFVENVVAGIDPLKQKREDFYKSCLCPPYGKTACENITNAILGVAEYKEN